MTGQNIKMKSRRQAVSGGKRNHVVRWSAGVAWVLIVAVLANVICFGPMYNNVAIILNSQAQVCTRWQTAVIIQLKIRMRQVWTI